MSIPTSQLETWTNPGADDSATTTYNRVKNGLESSESVLEEKEKSYEVYLQGSYKNSTNIYADSDVDLVVQLNSTYRRDLSRLSSTQKSKYKDSISKASYGWEDFHADVVETLKDKYGSNSVTEMDLAVVLETDALPLTADIVVCQQYRRYRKFKNLSEQEYDEGIVFWNLSTDKRLISYPKIHYENGAEKNDSTYGRYRETVRLFKNARSYLVSQGAISEDLASSFYIECLLYNAPSTKYKHDLQNRYTEIVNWLVEAQLKSFKCQNGIQDLFGNTTEWTTGDARKFIQKLVDLWNNWYDY